jgi:hypothetical protein
MTGQATAEAERRKARAEADAALSERNRQTATEHGLDGWELWVVRSYLGDVTWCAMPAGAGCSVAKSDCIERLSELVSDFEAGLPGHIARRQRERRQADPSSLPLCAMLDADLSAYQTLLALKSSTEALSRLSFRAPLDSPVRAAHGLHPAWPSSL